MSAMQQIFTKSVQNKQKIVSFFWIIYAIIFIGLIVSLYLQYERKYVLELYIITLWAGRLAMICFVIVLIPGILRRFSLNFFVKTLIMLFRRQLGLLVYSFAFFHYANMSLFPMILGKVAIQSVVIPFQVAGTFAFYLLTIMFFTSNDWSVKKLGKWWTRIHRVIYVIAWLLFFHVYWQGKESWSILIGIAAIAETLSLVYFYLILPYRKKNPPVPPVPPPPSVTPPQSLAPQM